MTLKITRFFTDALAKQAKISHFDNKVMFNSPEKINRTWREKIIDQFGDLFLNDANYIAACEIQAPAAEAPVDDPDEEAAEAAAPKIDPKVVKKFADLLTTVLGTEVPKADVKQLDKYLIVKITTK